MPNHTANNFTITGPKDTIMAFIERAKDKNTDERELSFNSFIPMPTELRHTTGPTRIDWCVNNWGTKWDCYEVRDWFINEVKVGRMSATIYYETAWSPVTQFWLKVSEMYPDCEFYHEFADEGGGFLGHETIQGGSLMHEVELDWDSDAGIELREGLGRYWPYEDEENVDEATVDE